VIRAAFVFTLAVLAVPWSACYEADSDPGEQDGGTADLGGEGDVGGIVDSAPPDLSQGTDLKVTPDQKSPTDVAGPDVAGPDAAGPDAAPPDVAVPPPATWTVSPSASKMSAGWAISTDGAGVSHIAGSYTGTLTVGSFTLKSKGTTDIFVAKVDKDGKFLWVVSAGGTSDDRGNAITVDSAGNSYVAGTFKGTAAFGSKALVSAGGHDAFVTKLDKNGKFLWASGAKASFSIYCYGVGVDSAGNSYVTGSFQNKIQFGAKTLTSTNYGVDSFVAKLDKNGKFLWAAQTGGAGAENSQNLRADSVGNSYIVGNFTGSASFGSKTITAQKGTDAFVAKLDTSGKFLWATAASGDYQVESWGNAIDGAGNSYITGWYHFKASFGSTTLTSKASYDMFVAKLDKSGKFVWATSSTANASASLAVGKAISVDSAGQAHVMGEITGTVLFGTGALFSNGSGDLFFAKLDGSGKFLWSNSAGGTKNDLGRGISLDSAGNSYLTGLFRETVSFGKKKLTASQYGNLFVAKVDKSGQW